MKHLGIIGLAVALAAPLAGTAQAANQRALDVAAHWTPERQAAATPRDLVIDSRGLGYLRGANGSLEPYGHSVAAQQQPNARPSGNDDTTPPTVTNMDPASGATIGDSYVFSATVTDAESGVKSVSFIVHFPSGSTQSFSPTGSGDTWSLSLQGFTDGAWGWQVEAQDNGRRGGNTTTTAVVPFSVDTGGGEPPPPPGAIVVNSPWSFGGAVQTAAGRLFYEMPANRRGNRWNGYVCSGTVITEAITGRSIIVTAAHCVYDDANKAFARNVLFIPNQAGTTGSGTDSDCFNDPLGCWAPSFGVVDVDWTTRKFPDNIPWDYAYYVANDSGSHLGYALGSDVLDAEAGSLPLSFSTPNYDAPDDSDVTYALGYSYSDDPFFMYSKEDMTTEGTDNWWLPSSGLSGGSSGGPWVQPMDEATGSGPIISVNSWGYTDQPGMAGPFLDSTTAACVLTHAETGDLNLANAPDGEAGIAATCP